LLILLTEVLPLLRHGADAIAAPYRNFRVDKAVVICTNDLHHSIIDAVIEEHAKITKL